MSQVPDTKNFFSDTNGVPSQLLMAGCFPPPLDSRTPFLLPDAYSTSRSEERPMTTYAGRPMKRFEDPQLLQGQGSFVDDKVLPGMVHAAVLRSPHAYAIIRSIDTSKAAALPGVVQVVTSDDIPGLETIPPRQTERLDDMKSPRHPCLGHRQGLLCGPSGGGSHRREPLRRTGRAGADQGGLRTPPSRDGPLRGPLP